MTAEALARAAGRFVGMVLIGLMVGFIGLLGLVVLGLAVGVIVMAAGWVNGW